MTHDGETPISATEVAPIRSDLYGEAARIITEALLHDPGWLSVGPSATAHRRVVARVYHRAAIGVMDRHGGPIYGAFRGGRLVGVAATFAAGLYPPPARTFFSYVPGFLLAGPAPIVRGLRVSAVQDGGHPPEPHVFLWFLAVDPDHQRRGIGRALLHQVFEDADAPVYLDTDNPANLPYYASFGFEEIGSGQLPRGVRMWFMRRP
jgi:ribosomal protein S18 acetylase RimI-like enzyme